MSKSAVVSERRGHVALITLNRPEARNAINAELSGDFCEALASAQDARAIVVTGAAPAFCAGLDLKDLGVPELRQLPFYGRAMAESAVPLIAAVNGAAVTGGLEIALGCDFIVASDRAVFADTHLRVGAYPGPVLVDLPRRIGMAWARELSLTGNFIDAATALRIGLVNHVTPHAELLAFALSLARAIADADPGMVSAMRRDWDASMGTPIEEARRIHREHTRAGGFGRQLGSEIASRRETVLGRSSSERQRLPRSK